MCLIVHKPVGVALPPELMASAAHFNPHGVGMVAFPSNGPAFLRRRLASSPAELNAWAEEVADQECVLHFRYGTRGAVDEDNVHPLHITDEIYLFHNGTLRLDLHTPARSDSWHLAQDFLAPILSRRPDLIEDLTFQRMLEAAAGPQNRLVLTDLRRRRTVIINREAGVQHEGLWLSNGRWFDPRVLSAGPDRPRDLALARPVAFFA